MNAAFEALAHPTRRDILALLKGGGRTAGDLAAAVGVSRPTMSAHFAKLKAAGLIAAEPRGAAIVYTLNLSVVEEVVLGLMNRLGSTIAEGAPCAAPI